MKMTNRWNRVIYRLWAPVYDATVGRIFAPGRRCAIDVLNLQPGQRVLLSGVGTGADLPLLPRGVAAIGVDLSPEMLEEARQKLPLTSSGTLLARADAGRLPLPERSFDAAILNLVLSVVPDPVACLRSSLAVLKPGGRIVIFDKFLSSGKPSPFRKLMNFFSTILGTDINRRFEELAAGLPCRVIQDEPSIGRGMYRVMLLEKTTEANRALPDASPKLLQGLPETLLIPLYVRAREADRTDALIRDPQAAAMIKRIDYDFSRIKLQEHDEVGILLRTREFDRRARAFVAAHPDAVVVHLGCGLDGRFERVDDGRVEWYDLDLPEVMQLRRALLDEHCQRHHLLTASVFDSAWRDEVGLYRPRPFLFVAEGLFIYFEEAQVKSLVLDLENRFPGAELVFDALTPLGSWLHNFQLVFSRVSARLQWGLQDPQELERWAPGIRLLEDWYYFDTPEPRLGESIQWMARVPIFGRMTGIFHYRLG
ncbi:MAG: methyltransferase domain-containing protein [Bacteroidota bacterium]